MKHQTRNVIENAFLLASFWLAEPEDRKKKGKININRLTEKLLFLVARTRRDLRLKNTQKKT